MFRPEVEAFRPDRLSGNVTIAVPVAWQVIGYFLLASVAAMALLLSLAQYSRIETATGAIVPEAGVAAVVTSRAGVVASLSVRDGQLVAAGTPLAAIRADVDSGSNLSFDAQVAAAIAQQDASLAARSHATGVANAAQQAQLLALRTGLSGEIAQIASQITNQEELVTSASADLKLAQEVAKRGFVSGNDVRKRQETLTLRLQSLSQLRGSLTAKRAALAQAERSSAQANAQTSGEVADITAQRAQVAQQAATAAGARSYVVRAPVDGRITALIARVGQPANAQTTLMTIVPTHSVLRAEVGVPTSAIGFVKPGQEVRLAIDAFPFQRFGTVSGKIISVARSAISRQRPAGGVEAIYPVMVALDRQQLAAFGRMEPLIPGMTLTARITTEKQSLLEWLFAPLYAVRGR